MQALPRNRRLQRRADFLRVQAGGVRVGTSHLLLLLLPRATPGPGRFGIVASKKVGGAVQRNRAKRLVREAMRRRQLDLIEEGIDLVVIVRPGTHALCLAELEAELSQIARLVRRRASEVTRPT